MKDVRTVRSWLVAELGKAAAGYEAQLAEKGPDAIETKLIEKTCRVLEDVLAFVDDEYKGVRLTGGFG